MTQVGEQALQDSQPHVITTVLNYWKDSGDGSLPEPVVVGVNAVKNERTMVPHEVVIEDVSGHEADYLLDVHGFQFVQNETQIQGLDEDGVIRTAYYPEVEQLLKKITGASRVVAYNHQLRHGPSNWHALGENNKRYRGPLRKVHVDQSYDGAARALEFYFPNEAAELSKRRFQIINVWRPLETVHKDPLAVADARSVPDADLVPAAIHYPDGRRGETYTVRPGAGHRWFFKYAQRPDEVLVFKIFDSDTRVARRAPHSAFLDPEAEDRPSRRSVEVRSFVFYD